MNKNMEYITHPWYKLMNHTAYDWSV